jgi:hypothetical protein
MFLTHITFDDIIHTLQAYLTLMLLALMAFFLKLLNKMQFIYHISWPISSICLSCKEGILPKILKSALVIPVYRSGSYSDPSNYRPISILTIFSKLLEKLY